MSDNFGSEAFKLFLNRKPELEVALTSALAEACQDLDFDLKCLDWFSYNPDFYIEKKNQKVA